MRAHGRTVIVYPGDVYPEVKRVFSETERFTIVEKLEECGEIAETLDPRAN